MSFETLTHKHLTNLKIRIQAELAGKGLDASGSASASLEVSGNQLTGNSYIYYLDQGRGPGKFPPTLVDWVRLKLGLEGREAKQVDFLVRRKIARQGTEIYRNKSKGIQLDRLIEETIDELTKELPDEVAVEALKWL
jgi:hypothetical protein